MAGIITNCIDHSWIADERTFHEDNPDGEQEDWAEAWLGITPDELKEINNLAYTKTLTNVERIRSMTDLELAEDRVAKIIGEDGITTYYTTNGNFTDLQDAINDELSWLNEVVIEKEKK
jgi:hypothetical protein